MSVQLFLSAVSDEFRSYRDKLRTSLQRHNVTVHVQEDFVPTGSETLDKLDDYIMNCDAIIHLAGDMVGSSAELTAFDALEIRYPDLFERLGPLNERLEIGRLAFSYTQWEAYLAVYHRKRLFIAIPDLQAVRDPNYRYNDREVRAQRDHLERLRNLGRYSEIRFANVDQLTAQVLRSSILDLLVDAEIEQSNDRRFTRAFSNSANWVIGSALALPIVISIASLVPPWPPRVALWTTVIEAATIPATYFYLRNCLRAIKIAMVASLALLSLFICLFLLLMSLYTYEIPTTGERVAKGFTCTADAVLVFKDKCPNLGIDELRAAEYDAGRLWTHQSITVIETTLAMLWLGMFVTVSVFAGAFVCYWQLRK